MNNILNNELSIKNKLIPKSILGEMCEADLTKSLSDQLVEDGYLLLRSVYDPLQVNVARQEILERLAEVGEVKEPISAAIFSGTSNRRSLHPTADDLGKFWKSVSEGSALRAVINGPKIVNIMEQLFGSPTAHFSFAWLRAMQAGRASPMHIDHPYMNRGTDQLVTCWSPIGPVNIDEGSLYILEGSHNWREIRNQFEGHDVDKDKSKPGHIQETPLQLVQQNNSRFLTTSFNPGDCLIFGMFTVHGSFDNNSQNGRIRLSCDTRFQPATEPMDSRFSGLNPSAHEGLGYSCLSAALPMNETNSLR